MIFSEWSEIIGRVSQLWGQSAKWAKAVDTFITVQDIPVAAFHRAIDDTVEEGAAYAPSIPELKKKARTYAPVSPLFDASKCEHLGSRRSIVEYLPDGGRVTRCRSCRGDEQTHPAGEWLTDSERDPLIQSKHHRESVE